MIGNQTGFEKWPRKTNQEALSTAKGFRKAEWNLGWYLVLLLTKRKSLMEKGICPGPFTQWEAERLPDYPTPMLLSNFIINMDLFAFALTAAVQQEDAFRHL